MKDEGRALLNNVSEIRRRLRELASARDAALLQRFFKTGRGEYAEGDVFIGVRVPATRKLAAQCAELPLGKLAGLLRSKIHEERLLALILLTRAFVRGEEAHREAIYALYLGHTRYVNNWDLVDASADRIVGEWLVDKPRAPLYRLARSTSLWERRIAIMATFAFIKRREADDTLRMAQRLLNDSHDLIHKATGWMLREVGKRVSRRELVAFLDRHAAQMPRTMLRYAIEHLPRAERERYLRAAKRSLDAKAPPVRSFVATP